MARGGREPIRRTRSRFPLLALTLSIPVIGLLGFVGYRFFHQNNPVDPRAPSRVVVKQQASRRAGPRSAPQIQPKKTKRIVLIVDDVGYDDRRLRTLIALEPKLTFAIIPGTPNARKSAEMLRQNGFEVLCHLPMEPLGYPGLSAGNGAILTSMSSAQIREQTRKSLRSVPFARGVNNHMGSRATTDRRVMTAVMSVPLLVSVCLSRRGSRIASMRPSNSERRAIASAANAGAARSWFGMPMERTISRSSPA